jgi:hypothetical protein
MEIGKNIDTNHESPTCILVNTIALATTPLLQVFNVIPNIVTTM